MHLDVTHRARRLDRDHPRLDLPGTRQCTLRIESGERADTHLRELDGLTHQRGVIEAPRARADSGTVRLGEA